MHQMDDNTFEALRFLVDFLDGMVEPDGDTIHLAYELVGAWMENKATQPDAPTFDVARKRYCEHQEVMMQQIDEMLGA